MTQQTDGNTRTSTDDRAPHAMNQRVERLRGGLEKAVTGREEAIKAQALKWAEQLDTRWQGRHHNKLQVALKAVEFIVDNAARRRDGESGERASTAADGSTRDAGATRPTGFTSGRRTSARADNAPEDLGEFRNLSDEPQPSR